MLRLCWVPVWAIGRSATYLQLQGRADLLVRLATNHGISGIGQRIRCAMQTSGAMPCCC